MRSSRAIFVLAAGAASVLLVGCGSGNDSAGSPSLDPGNVIEEEAVDPAGDGTVDDSSLRSGAEGRNSSRVGADDAPRTDRPTPPTLSSAGAAGLSSSTTEQPPPSTTAPTTTIASTTTVSSDTTSTAEGDASSTTETTATTATTAPDPNGSSTTTVVVAGEKLDAGEDHSLALLNELRVGLSLSTLAEDAEMASFARDWSRQMASSGNFDHSTGPYGENIAFTSNTALTAAEAADLFHDLWLDSPGHYGNMTNESYVKTGVGLFLTERGWYATHVFSY